jgi:hypothetical protein
MLIKQLLLQISNLSIHLKVKLQRGRRTKGNGIKAKINPHSRNNVG